MIASRAITAAPLEGRSGMGQSNQGMFKIVIVAGIHAWRAVAKERDNMGVVRRHDDAVITAIHAGELAQPVLRAMRKASTSSPSIST
jgi:hypothetical protein